MNQYLKYLSGKFNKGKEKIYIFFTGQGLIILSCLSLIFLICMIYGNSMAYLGLFLFFTTLSLSAIQTNENLRGVSLDLSQDKMGGYSPLSLPFLLVSKSSNNAFMLNIEGKNIKGTTHR